MAMPKTNNPIIDAIAGPTQRSSSFLFTERLMSGEIFATPTVDPVTGIAWMHIVGWDDENQCERVIDQGALDALGDFASPHHIPTRVLDLVCNGEMGFNNGGRYVNVTQWDYPFHGDRIGAWVIEK